MNPQCLFMGIADRRFYAFQVLADSNNLGYTSISNLSGFISDKSEVKVLYFPNTNNMRETVLVDEDNTPISLDEMEVHFTHHAEPLSEEHELFAVPNHRQWATWDPPFENWVILLQINSFEGKDFILNFMDFGVLDFLISPEALKLTEFSNVRGIVLLT